MLGELCRALGIHRSVTVFAPRCASDALERQIYKGCMLGSVPLVETLGTEEG